MPPDYLQRLLTSGAHDTGLVSAPPIGCASRQPLGRARMRLPQHLSGALAVCSRQPRHGLRAGQDHALAPQRSRGGRRHLGAGERAGRGCSRHQGRARRGLAGAPAPTAPSRSRWASDRRGRCGRGRCAGRVCGAATFPGFFALEIFSGLLAPLAGACAGRAGARLRRRVPLAAAYTGLWLAAEAWLAAAAGWPFSWRSPLMWLLRELLLPVLWMQAWFGNSLELARQRHDRCARHGMDGAGFALLTPAPVRKVWKRALHCIHRIADARVPRP